MNEIEIKYIPDEIWRDFYQDNWDLAILIGGRGSGKTWNTGNRTAIKTHANPNHRTLVLRDVATSIEQSILQNIKDRFTLINERSGDQYSKRFEVQESQIKNKVENKVILFTKGFRQSRVDQSGDMKGFEDIDEAILEEAEDLRDEERVNTLLDTLRKEGNKVIIILNTPDSKHWIVKRYFTLRPSEYEGYFYLVPKKIEGVLQVVVDFRDNPHLAPKTSKKYASYNDHSSHLYNPDYYAGKILGLASSGRFGQVFKHIKPCTLEQYNSFDYDTFYGLDFGFTNDPTALIEIKAHNRTAYCRELIYDTGLTNGDIATALTRLGVSKLAPIYADSAEPKSIEELRRLGWNVLPAVKGTDSINAGIQFINSYQIFDYEGSTNLWNENESYIYALDRDKNPTNKPQDDYNHLQDARRYGFYTHLANRTEYNPKAFIV